MSAQVEKQTLILGSLVSQVSNRTLQNKTIFESLRSADFKEALKTVRRESTLKYAIKTNRRSNADEIRYTIKILWLSDQKG